MKFKEWDTAREYNDKKTKILHRDEKGYPDYLEIPYKEYHMDGKVIEGTEDFSKERLEQCSFYGIHTPTGKLNKGGHMMWNHHGAIMTHSAKDAKIIAFLKYGESAVVRKF